LRAAELVELAQAPDQAAAWLAVELPGPDSVAAVSMLDVGRLSAAGRVETLVAIERQIAWLQARQQRVLAMMGEQAGRAAARHSDDQWVREDVACALRLSPPY
jgi:hypothetical protein